MKLSENQKPAIPKQEKILAPRLSAQQDMSCCVMVLSTNEDMRQGSFLLGKYMYFNTYYTCVKDKLKALLGNPRSMHYLTQMSLRGETLANVAHKKYRSRGMAQWFTPNRL